MGYIGILLSQAIRINHFLPDLAHEEAVCHCLHGLPAEGARLAPQLLPASLAKRVTAWSQHNQGTIFMTNATGADEAGTVATCTCRLLARNCGRTIPGNGDFEAAHIHAVSKRLHVKTAKAMVL